MPNIPIFSSPVIKLDPDPRPQAWGQALGNVMGEMNRQQVLQQATTIQDPQKKIEFITQRLGPDGAKFVTQMLQTQELQGEIARQKSQAITDQLDQRIKGFEADHAQASFDLNVRKTNAEIAASQAAVAGRGADAAAKAAEIRHLDAETAAANQKLQMEKDRAARIKQLIEKSKGGPGGQPQPGATSAPTPGSQSSAEPTDGTGTPRKVASIDQPTPAEASSRVPGLVKSAFFAPQNEGARLQLVSSVEQGKPVVNNATPTTKSSFNKGGISTDEPQLPPDMQDQYEMLLLDGKDKEAFDLYNSKNKPIRDWDEVDKDNPAIKWHFGLYPDGKVRPYGEPRYDPKEPDKETTDMAPSLTLLYEASKSLRKIIEIDQTPGMSEAEKSKAAGDALGGLPRRLQDKVWRELLHGAPAGDQATVNLKNMYATLLDHEMLPAMELIRGAGQRGVGFYEMFKQMLPDYLADPSVKIQNLNAMDHLLAQTVNLEITNSRGLGKLIPPSITDLSKMMGIEGKTPDEIQGDYFRASSRVGLDPHPSTTIEGGTSKPPAAKEAAEPPPDEGFRVGKNVYSQSQIDGAAKDLGIDPVDVIPLARREISMDEAKKRKADRAAAPPPTPGQYGVTP